jgi:replication factor A1
MGKTIDDLYSLVQDLIPRKDFDSQINERKARYDELLDDETIALLYVDELGRNTTCLSAVRDLKAGVECSCIGSITVIQNTRTFQRKNGSTGKVANLILSDDSGSITLVLWNEQVDLVTEQKIREQTQVKITNGYVKDGYYGPELCVGRWSQLEILDQPTTPPSQAPSMNPTSINGVIETISPTRPFFKDDGSFGFVTTLCLKTTSNIETVTVWDEKVKQLQQFSKGDHLRIEGVDIRHQNGNKELHINGKARITKT